MLEKEVIKIVQLSDTHLFADDETMIYGVKSNQTFQQVVKKFLEEDAHDTDCIFLTGDLTQDETETSYLKLANTLKPINIPIYWIPGNHDHILTMEKAFNTATPFIRHRSLSTDHWEFIFLNTKLEAAIDGYLSDEELLAIKNLIEAIPKHKSIAIIMHHHPAKVNTPLIDQYILRNSDDFWHVVTGTQIKLIMCGHVHGDYQFIHNNIHIETTPATCLQWKKGTTQLMFTNEIGYKIYKFSANNYHAQAKLWTMPANTNSN